MAVITGVSSGLEGFGIGPVRSATRNLTAAALFEEAIRRREGAAAVRGPLVVRTGKHTGRSPQDKFFVREAGSERNVDWGKTNKPFEQAKFDALLDRVADYLHEKDVYVLDAFAGEPGAEIAIDFNQAVFGAAGDPEQVKLLAGFGVQRGKFLIEFGSEAAGAESADVGKFIKSVEAGEQRFGAAHGQAGDGAGVAISLDEISGFDLRDDFG